MVKQVLATLATESWVFEQAGFKQTAGKLCRSIGRLYYYWADSAAWIFGLASFRVVSGVYLVAFCVAGLQFAVAETYKQTVIIGFERATGQ